MWLSVGDRFRCSPHARASGEPRFGTASQVRRWILVEQQGPWGREALMQSPLPTEVASELRRLARAVAARPLLIRRHGRYVPVRSTCLVAVTTPNVRRVERILFDHPTELLDLDWSPLASALPVGGEPIADPVYLVCTNGRHDACCAQFGRPLVRDLSRAFPEQVWESSHFGGDRFAGNLVCLPHGLYYGHVASGDGPRLAELYAQGRVDLDHYRGLSYHSFVVQAADYFVRRDRGLDRLEDLRVESVEQEADATRVTFSGPDGTRPVVLVESVPAEEPRHLTCTAERATQPPRYRLVATIT